MIKDKMTKEFYKQWLQGDKPLMLSDTLYYVQGINPNSLEAKFYKKSTKWLYMKAILQAAEHEIISLNKILAIHDTKGFRWNPLKKMSVISPIEFTQHMYQFISDFPEELFKAYKEVTGEELFLTDYSPVKFFYVTQAELDLWDVRKACYFIAHADPDWRSWHLYSPYLPPMHSYKMISDIIKMAKTSMQAKQLECFEGNPNLVRPLSFLQWADKKNFHPHPFLIERVKQCSSEKSEAKYSPENLEVPNKNENIHHRQIEAVAKSLKHLYPDITIAEIEKHHAILEFAGGKHYFGKHTLRRWISGSFPKGAFQWGRPRKNSKKTHLLDIKMTFPNLTGIFFIL